MKKSDLKKYMVLGLLVCSIPLTGCTINPSSSSNSNPSSSSSSISSSSNSTLFTTPSSSSSSSSSSSPSSSSSSSTSSVDVLKDEKENAIKEVEEYKDLSLYLPEQAEQINSMIETTKALIQNASTIEEIEKIVSDYKAAADRIKTKSDLDAEALEKYKQNAIEQISSFVDLELYREEEKVLINKLKTETIASVNEKLTMAEIDEVLVNFKAEISKLKTDDQYVQEELNAYKTEVLAQVETFVKLDDYREEEQTKIADFKNTANTEINNAKTKSEVDTAYEKFYEAILTLKTKDQYEKEELAARKKTAENEIIDYKDPIIFRKAEEDKYWDLADQYTALLTDAKTIDEVNTIVANFKAAVDLLAVDTGFTGSLENAVNVTFTKSEEDLVADLLVIPDNSDWTGDGVAFRIKNNTGESYIAIYINEKDSDRVVLETGATYYTYDLQGVKKSTTSGRGWGNYIKLESNFDGYIYIPYSSFAIKAGFASGNDVMNYANVFGMYFETSAFYDSYQNYTIGEIQVLNGDVVKTVLDNSKQTSASYKNHYIADYNGKYINLNFTGEILEPSKLPFEGTLNGGVDVTFKADTSDGLATMLVKPQTLDWSGDGFILRIKENSGIQSFIDLRINETDSDRAKIKLNAAFYLYDLDGNVTETTSGRSWNSYILLPANFDGYVYVPYSSLEFENGGGDNNLTFASVWGIYLGTSKQFDAYQNYSVGSIIIKNGDTYKTVLDPTTLDDTTYSSNYTKDIFGDFINIARHK